ncbi:MAG: hypothetical protein AVDCRST_MAG90-2343, partial [uncultured Microvirga sp.]
WTRLRSASTWKCSAPTDSMSARSTGSRGSGSSSPGPIRAPRGSTASCISTWWPRSTARCASPARPRRPATNGAPRASAVRSRPRPPTRS